MPVERLPEISLPPLWHCPDLGEATLPAQRCAERPVSKSRDHGARSASRESVERDRRVNAEHPNFLVRRPFVRLHWQRWTTKNDPYGADDATGWRLPPFCRHIQRGVGAARRQHTFKIMIPLIRFSRQVNVDQAKSAHSARLLLVAWKSAVKKSHVLPQLDYGLVACSRAACGFVVLTTLKEAVSRSAIRPLPPATVWGCQAAGGLG